VTSELRFTHYLLLITTKAVFIDKDENGFRGTTLVQQQINTG